MGELLPRSGNNQEESFGGKQLSTAATFDYTRHDLHQDDTWTGRDLHETTPGYVYWYQSWPVPDCAPPRFKTPSQERRDFISYILFWKAFCRTQLPHKSVNLSFTINNIKNRFTDFCGNRMLQIAVEKSLREIRRLIKGGGGVPASEV